MKFKLTILINLNDIPAFITNVTGEVVSKRRVSAGRLYL